LIERYEIAALKGDLGQSFTLLFGAIAPKNLVGLA
jgi:hypothetical protein